MNSKRKIILSLFTFLLFVTAIAQNSPEFTTPKNNTVIVNSGINYLIIPNISDGDTTVQQLSFEVVSSNDAILQIDSVSYSNGNKMALIWVNEQGVLGEVELTVSISDEDGTTSKSFGVFVSKYTHHGVKFEIHDAIFWQEVVPLNETPIFDSIIQSSNMKAAYDNLNWDNIPITVSAGCDNAALCDGHDFSTGLLKGFLVPETTGNYSFYIDGDSDYALFLSPDEKFENATVIAAKSDNHGKVGVSVGGRKSDSVLLEAEKVYAIYAAQWNIHNENGGVKWELQNQFGAKYIDGSFLYPEYDVERPEVVGGLNIAFLGDRFMKILWNKSTDDQIINGYNIYLNGLKINEKLISETDYLIENLTTETDYSIAISAVDLVNNESFINEIVNATTLSLDTIAPIPPTSLNVDEATGIALLVSWDGAVDNETGIYGYNIYLDGKLFNTDSLIYTNSTVLKVLAPLTEYNVEIEAVDIGMNVSERSQVFYVSTVEFDPANDNLGLKTGRIEFSTDAISYNEGIGINTNFKNGEVFNSVHTELLEDLQPGAIRWGALTANPLSFSSYVGAGKSVTIGKFFKRCNDLDAYTVFCCGVENSTDWIKNDETFIRFLEYINGPDETEGGQLRVSEGYSEPFMNNSKGLIFEFGNEVWGGDSHNAQIGENYINYAQWCRKIATKMRASEYFDSTKISLAYSSRYPGREDSYGLNDKLIIGDTGEVDWTAPSGYLGGNLDYDPALPPAESELEYYKNVRQRADRYLNGIVLSHKFEVEKTGRIFKQYMYESNTTTPTYNGRLGQALLSTDYYLTAMELGSAIPTLFHLTGGQWRITESENNYRRMPLFLTAKYFNQLCKGDVLYNKYYSNQMNASEPGAMFSKRPVGAHTYRNKNGYTVVLVSRDYEEDHYVQIDLPDDLEVDSVGKIYSITGVDFNTKYAIVDSAEVKIKDKLLIVVPKHGMIFLRFNSPSIEMENLPLAHYIYPQMNEISIYAPKNEFTNPNEKLSFRATYSPTQSWDNIVEWSLLNNSGNYSFSVTGTFCYVYSGNFVGNETDSLILRASNRFGDIYDEVVIHLPETPVNSELLKNESGFKVYPNPANSIIYVDVDFPDSIKIYSVNGTKVFENVLNKGRNEININKLSNGLYTLKIGNKLERLLVTD